MEGLGNGFIGEMLATKAGPAVGLPSPMYDVGYGDVHLQSQ